MSAPAAVICSFRLGGTDGVSVEARKWEWALHEIGFTTRRVAGELGDGLRTDDTWLPFLGIDPPPGARPQPDELAAAIAGADLVVVENLCSLPLNLTASATAAEVLDAHAGRVLFHHHDLPWERAHLAQLADAFPPRRPNSLHVTINEHARRALAERGIEATTIRNAFDLQPAPGDREGTRRWLGVSPDDHLLLQPTRAIPRKEVGRGIGLAERLAGRCNRPVVFWLTGPAEDGFDAEVAALLDAASVDVRFGRTPRAQDAYAAADVVVFPSSWEGFGNPVIEAIAARKPIVTATYPALDELVALGLDLFSVDDVERVERWLRTPDEAVLERNLSVVESHFDLRDLPGRLRSALTTVGWTEW
jgi:glycosyltransferase involved in cell wall biosynthesis